MRYSKMMLIAMLCTLGTQMAEAVPTTEEAAELGKSLTPFGAIKAGNKEGTIPEWTGGVCTPPSGYHPRRNNADGTPGGAPYVDPFAADKPLFKITAADMAKYVDKLDDGTKNLLRLNPQTFYVLVYPTRRSACFPNWMYENTIKKVMNPRIVGGNIPSLANAHAQIPFPIPKTGVEVMWNTAVKPEPVDTLMDYSSWYVDSNGKNKLIAIQSLLNHNAYWDNSLSSIPDDKPYWILNSPQIYPAGQVGGMTMIHYYLRPDLKGNPAWAYIPGQRRVRMAPEFTYDGVMIQNGGIVYYDEANGFGGNMDRFDFKLVGRKELYVPYNDYAFWDTAAEKENMQNHVDPNVVRFELHRVWVVEATLKPGERHVQAKKVFYVDEDSWNMLVYLGYDQSNKIEHLRYFPPVQSYDKPEIRNTNSITYDFTKRSYLLMPKSSGESNLYGSIKTNPFPADYFTPTGMAGMGVR